MRLRPGWYIYTGSACGPGGLRARVGHHLRVAARPRWHIDYLRARAEVCAVWFACGAMQREHQWAARVASLPGAELPMPGFGSSDCGCLTHLTWFKARPDATVFRRALGRASALP